MSDAHWLGSGSSRARLKVPILMYHAVEAVPRPAQYKHFYVTAGEFVRQMNGLKRSGYTTVTLGGLANALAGKSVLPARPVVLTFDDGYASVIENAHPLLCDLGFVYTLFLVPGRIGGRSEWVEQDGYEASPLLSWEQIQRMQESKNVEFASHTMTHPHLAAMSDADAATEMAQSRNTLEHQLHQRISCFCYPYGDYTNRTVQIAKDCGYTCAVTTQFGRARPGDDPMKLPRISVYHVPLCSLTYGHGGANFWWRIRSRKDTRPAST